jgi:CBS-domain-containing membrane protein
MWIEIPATVSLIMTREVVSVEEGDSLTNLLESMRALRFRHLPVTQNDRLIGLLTERDLLRISTSNLLPAPPDAERAILERYRVRDVMVRDVVTVTPDTEPIPVPPVPPRKSRWASAWRMRRCGAWLPPCCTSFRTPVPR